MYQLFVTVGSRFPMDRLISSVDDFVSTRQDFDAFAQIGSSDYQAQSLSCESFLDKSDFIQQFVQSDIIISHAGMGNVLLAREKNKKIILLPRRKELGEHINNHQVDTVNGLKTYPNIFVIEDEKELPNIIDYALMQEESIEKSESEEKKKLILSLREYISDE